MVPVRSLRPFATTLPQTPSHALGDVQSVKAEELFSDSTSLQKTLYDSLRNSCAYQSVRRGAVDGRFVSLRAVALISDGNPAP